jgi:hypothetical protein
VVVFVGLAVLQMAACLAPFFSGRIENDFTAFYSQWSLIHAGRVAELYDASAQGQTQRALMGGATFKGGVMASLHPPPTAFVLSPLAFLPLPWAFRLWTIVQGSALVWFVQTVQAIRRHAGLQRHPLEPWLWGAGLLAFRPFSYALGLGQISIVLALAAARLYWCAETGRSVRAGLWLVVLLLKPQLAPMFVVWLLARGLSKAVIVATAATAVLVGATTIALGPGVWRSYVVSLPTLETYWGSGTPEFMCNLRSVLARAFSRTHPNWPARGANAAWVLSWPIVYLAVRKVAVGPAPSRAFAVAVAAGLFFSPHSFLQDLTLLPLVLLTAVIGAQRLDGAAGPAVEVLAVAWPFLALASDALEFATHRRLPLSLTTLALALTLVVAGWELRGNPEERSA